MSLNSGKVLSYATRNKKCRTCQNSKSKGKSPKVHDCRLKYKGSSKYMETDKDAIKDQVKYTSYVGDDDSTTLAELVKQVSYELHKFSDIIHIKRSLGTRLYNLSQRVEFPDSSSLSQKVINYLQKCFSYCIVLCTGAEGPEPEPEFCPILPELEPEFVHLRQNSGSTYLCCKLLS